MKIETTFKPYDPVFYISEDKRIIIESVVGDVKIRIWGNNDQVQTNEIIESIGIEGKDLVLDIKDIYFPSVDALLESLKHSITK